MGTLHNMIFGTAGIPATCTITSDESEFTDDTPFEIQITFDKARDDLVVGDLNDVNDNCDFSSFANSGDDLVYTCDVTPDLSGGDIQISIDADVTAEGNDASNLVTVTDEVAVPLAVAWVYGADGFGVYDQADFPSGINDDSEIISNGVILTPAAHNSARYGANAYFGEHTVDDSVVTRVDFTRELLVAISGTTGESYEQNVRYQMGTIVGLVFNSDIADISKSSASNNTQAGTISTSVLNVMACIRLGQFDDAKYGRFSRDNSAPEFDTTPQDAVISITSAAFELSKDGTGWIVEFFINGTSTGSHDLYGLDDDEISQIVPYCHNGCYGGVKPTSEKITNVTITES